MEFETDIKQLTQELFGAFDSRAKAVASMRASTLAEMRADQAAHRKAAAEQREHLQQHVAQLHDHVKGMRKSAQQEMNEMRDATIAVGIAQQQRLAAQNATLKQETSDFMARTGKARAEMSQQQRQALNQKKAQVRQASKEFIAHARAARLQAAANKQQTLHHYMTTLQEDVTAMRGDTQQFVAELEKAHAAMSEAQQAKLADAHTQLQTDVLSMRHNLQSAQATLRADQVAAGNEWARFAQMMTGQRSGSAETVAPVAESAAPVAQPESPLPPVTMPEPEPVSILPFTSTPATPAVTAVDEGEDEKKKMI